ncbi:MAG TPA: NosD domain-containing protein, partial [bacterium]|nr:NosD domain-containing protein [bacterium]
SDVTVAPGAVLTIDPGVEVRFASPAASPQGPGPNLRVKGALRALGNPKAPISFVPAIPGGFWGSIDFDHCDSANSALSGCRVTGGRVAFEGSSPAVTGCALSRSKRALEVGADSHPTIKGNRLQGNTYGLVLSSDTASPVAEGNVITGNHYGVYLKAFGAPVITGNRVHGNLKYNFVNSSAKPLDIPNNDFQTADAALIARGVYDGASNPAVGRLNFKPFLTAYAAPASPAPVQAASKPAKAGAFIPQIALSVGLSEMNLFTPSSFHGVPFPADGKTFLQGVGASFFADYRFWEWISLGFGAYGVYFPRTSSFALSSVDLGGRLFPLGASPTGELYLLGGLGLNSTVLTLDDKEPGHYHGFAGAGYRFFMGPGNGLELGVQYDYLSDTPAYPLHGVSLKVGWTFLIDRD